MKKFYLFFIVLFVCLLLHAQTASLSYYPFVYHQGWIVVEGMVNDSIKVNITLDTGATNFSMSRTYVDKHHINKGELKEDDLFNRIGGGVGTGKSGLIWMWEKIAYTFGGRTFEDPSYKVYPNLKNDALYGITPKSQSTFEVYYDKQQYRFYPGKALIPTKEFNKMNFMTHAVKITVPMKIRIGKRTISGDFLIDTGSRHSVFLTTAVAKKYALAQADSVTLWKKALGLSGESTGGTIKAQKVVFGKDTFEDMDIHFSMDEKGALAESPFYIGIIGNRFLEKYDLVIDYTSNKLYYRHNSYYDLPFQATLDEEP